MTTVVACYSEGTAYEEEARLLVASLDAVGMAHEIRPFPDRGGWYANTAAKAEMIRAFRYDLTGPLLYIDVDAFVHQNCTAYFDRLAADGYDFGAHWFAGPKGGYDASRICWKCEGEQNGRRLLSGTLFLGDTDACRSILDAWCGVNAALRDVGAGQGGGQKNLWFVQTHIPHRHAPLPGRYCYCFDKGFAYEPGEPCIIEHTIASRDHRAKERTTVERAARILQLRSAPPGAAPQPDMATLPAPKRRVDVAREMLEARRREYGGGAR